MSMTKEVLLYAMADAAGYGDQVGAYLNELNRVRDMDREYDLEMDRRDKEEMKFWKSVNDGSYFEGSE